MTISERQQQAVDIMSVMSVAINNIRRYPSASTIIKNNIDRIFHLFKEFFEKESSVIFAEHEENYIICGEILTEEEQKRYPQALLFLELLHKTGISTLSFESRLKKDELKIFLEILSKDPRETENQNDFCKMIEAESLPNIFINRKIPYIYKSEKKSAFPSVEETIKYALGHMTPHKDHDEMIRMSAKNHKWMSQVFGAGVKKILSDDNEKTFEQISGNMIRLIRFMEDISDSGDQELIFFDIAKNIAELNDDIVILNLWQSIEGMINERLFDNIIYHLDEEKCQRLIRNMNHPDIDANHKRDSHKSDEMDIVTRVYRYMALSEKGVQLQKRLRNRLIIEDSRKVKMKAVMKVGINSILKGEETFFSDELVMKNLPVYLLRFISSPRKATGEAVLAKLAHGLFHQNSWLRNRVALAIAKTGELLISNNYIDSYLKISTQLIGWMKTDPDPPIHIFKPILKQLQNTAQQLIRGYRIAESVPILEIFNQIARGQVRKSEEIRLMAKNMLKITASNDVLDLLINEFRAHDEKRRVQAIAGLIQLGEASIEKLLSILQNNRKISERKRILELVGKIGEPAANLLVQSIKKGGPWLYIRNMILMLERVGTPKHVKPLIPFLRHYDFRIQHEALNCIFKIGGDLRPEVLLSALNEADERIRLNIIEMLGSLKYEKSVPHLIELLETKSSFGSKTDEKLKEMICTALGRIGDTKAVPVLSSIVSQKVFPGKKSYCQSIREAAARALEQIKSKEPENISNPDIKSFGDSKAQPVVSGDEISPEKYYSWEDQLASKPVRRDDDTIEETVVTILYEAIIEAARKKDFKKAEDLRQQLIETDPMAFTEIIRSGEIIEEERSDHVEFDQNHLGIWPELYNALDPDEADALYYAMEEAVYEPDHIIFKQGEANSRLYFIRRGQLKLVFSQKTRESLLKILVKGDVVGEDTFFSVSLCTTSLITLSRVYLFYLDRKNLEIWKEMYPALESKIHDYCLQLDSVQEILQKRGMDRRGQKRTPHKGIIYVQILDSSNRVSGKEFTGSLCDISVGGLSFTIQSVKKENINLLLGRRLNMRFEYDPGLKGKPEIKPGVSLKSQKIKADIQGTIIGVSHKGNIDYLMHIKFDEPLNEFSGDVKGEK